MDFLDPSKKRLRRIPLYISYGPMLSVVTVGTIVLVYAAYGYGINTKTGDVIKNGLLFVDSQPAPAEIFLNGNDTKSGTSARMVLPAGSYNLLLKRDGYRAWQRQLDLKEHSIQRFVYPFLWPTQLSPQTVQAYPASPSLMSQSPDRRWLLVENTNPDPTILSFDQYDTSRPEVPKQIVNFPAALFTSYNHSSSTFSEVEWASDNRHLLITHSYPGGREYVILDRSSPGSSVNLNVYAALGPSQISLRNKKSDQFYVLDQASASLQQLTLSTKVLTPILSGVITFKSLSDDLIIYATAVNEPAGKAAINIWDRSNAYRLQAVPTSDRYLMDAGQFQGHWYYIAGASSADGLNLYRDPLDALRDPAKKSAVAMTKFALGGAQAVGFSSNTRFISSQAGQTFNAYDLETLTKYVYTVDKPLVATMKWMDGHRLIGQTQGTALVNDYDGTNQQLLVPSILPTGGFFDRDYKQMLVLAGTSGSPVVALQKVNLRAGADAK